MGQQKPREKPNKPKKPKKTILNGLTQDSSHRIGFFGFSSSFWTIGLGRVKKPREKPKKIQKKKKQFYMDLPKILLTGLFFLVSLNFWTFGKLRMEKKGKKQNVQKPNAPSVGFCLLNTQVVSTGTLDTESLKKAADVLESCACPRCPAR